ncbi:hypothetical protein Tco_1401049 [Tanacetum coccineum]
MNYSNGENQVVSKSSAVTTTDASDKRQQQQDSISSTSTLATTITADENFDFDDGKSFLKPIHQIKFLVGIEEHEPYSIVDKPSTGLIYLNSKDEKQAMFLIKIVKFYDATLEKVLKKVKLKIFQSKPWKKKPLLGELDRDIMKAFEREITKHLRH